MPAMGGPLDARASVRSPLIHPSTIRHYLLPAGIGADTNDPPGFATPHIRQENTVDVQRSENICTVSCVSNMANYGFCNHEHT